MPFLYVIDAFYGIIPIWQEHLSDIQATLKGKTKASMKLTKLEHICELGIL